MSRNTAKLPAAATAAIRLSPETWDRWMAFVGAVESGDYDLTVEDFAAMRVELHRLYKLGVPFSPHLMEWFEDVEAQAIQLNHDDDSDQDGSDQWLEDGIGFRPPANPQCPADPRNWRGYTFTIIHDVDGEDVPVKTTAYGWGVGL